MNKIFVVSFVLLLVSCTQKSGKEKNVNVLSIDSAQVIMHHDTIIIDHYKENEFLENRSRRFSKLSTRDLIDSLKSMSLLQGIQELNETKLPFSDPQNLSKYYTYNVPLSIYKRIFPNEQIEVERIHNNAIKINEKEKTVLIQKGPQVKEKRFYKSLLSLIEKEDYLQLLFTKQGKYVPDIDLITVLKSNFGKNDSLTLYGGIYDSYDINYCHSSFVNNFSSITSTKISNKSFNSINLDTIVINYIITDKGEILRSNN